MFRECCFSPKKNCSEKSLSSLCMFLSLSHPSFSCSVFCLFPSLLFLCLYFIFYFPFVFVSYCLLLFKIIVHFYWICHIYSLWTLSSAVYECLFIDILYLQVWKSLTITELLFIIKSNLLMGSWQKIVLIKNAALQINKHFHYAINLTITLACILFMSITILCLQNMAPNRIITTPVHVTLLWK